MATKSIILDWSEVGKTLYAIIRREADGYLMDDADGSFGAAPADPYLSLAENATIKGRYEAGEGRTVWTDGRYTFAVYRQAGGSPAPASDTIIGTGEMKAEGDAEVTGLTLTEIEASGIIAKQVKLDFVEKWLLNRLVESPAGDAITLYDDDNVTPLKTWAYDSSTKTRSKAT